MGLFFNFTVYMSGVGYGDTSRTFEFIGVLRHMQQYFSHICDGRGVQAD